MIPTRSLASLALRPGVRPSTALRPFLAGSIRRRIDHESVIRRPLHRAWESTIVTNEQETKENATPSEEKESGRFDVKPNESILFFDSK